MLMTQERQGGQSMIAGSTLEHLASHEPNLSEHCEIRVAISPNRAKEWQICGREGQLLYSKIAPQFK